MNLLELVSFIQNKTAYNRSCHSRYNHDKSYPASILLLTLKQTRTPRHQYYTIDNFNWKPSKKIMRKRYYTHDILVFVRRSRRLMLESAKVTGPILNIFE